MTTLPKVGEAIALRRYNGSELRVLAVVTEHGVNTIYATALGGSHAALCIWKDIPRIDHWVTVDEMTDEELAILARWRLTSCTT